MGGISLSLPLLTKVDRREIRPVLRDAGLTQIPLTATNAVIATSVLISEELAEPASHEPPVGDHMGVMNVVQPFFGGVPLCHGAKGPAGGHYLEAGTGGTNIIEGVIENGDAQQ